MPHKRAKHAERVADKAKRGKDLPPSSDMHFQSLPKGAMRILHGAKIQAEYREKKKQREVEAAKKKKNAANTGQLQIGDGEKMGDFNRRVESCMAKEIQGSIRATRDSTKKRKRKGEDDAEPEKDNSRKSKSAEAGIKEADSKSLKKQREALETKTRQIEFPKAQLRKRLNDVVQAPPTLTKAPRGESKIAKERKATLESLMTGKVVDQDDKKSARLPDPIQKGGFKRQAMLQEERKRVVQAYRHKKQLDIQSRQ